MSFRAAAYALQQPQDAQQKLLVKWWGVAVYNTLLWDVAKSRASVTRTKRA